MMSYWSAKWIDEEAIGAVSSRQVRCKRIGTGGCICRGGQHCGRDHTGVQATVVDSASDIVIVCDDGSERPITVVTKTTVAVVDGILELL
jgi:hypothetical protein